MLSKMGARRTQWIPTGMKNMTNNEEQKSAKITFIKWLQLKSENNIEMY